MQEIEKNEIVEIEYTQPKFWHRVVANFVDIFIFVIFFVSLFFATRAIVQNTPSYTKMTHRMEEIQMNSGIYVYSRANGRTFDIIYYLEKINTTTYGNEWDGQGLPDEHGEPTEPVGMNGKCIKAINEFIAFAKENSSEAAYQSLVKYYDDFRLNAKYEETHYFIKDSSDKIVVNPTFADIGTNRKYYYLNVFKPVIEKYCIPYLESNVREYAGILRTDFYLLVFVEFATGYTLAAILTYYVPGLIFRRGRMTFGKALYRIGLVDARILSPTVKRFTVRFIMFFFLELVLSMFSFGIPFLISFSMMAFSKRKQGFPDYILNLQEVDTSKCNIYLDYVEAELKNDLHGKAIDFEMIKPL